MRFECQLSGYFVVFCFSIGIGLLRCTMSDRQGKNRSSGVDGRPHFWFFFCCSNFENKLCSTTTLGSTPRTSPFILLLPLLSVNKKNGEKEQQKIKLSQCIMLAESGKTCWPGNVCRIFCICSAAFSHSGDVKSIICSLTAVVLLLLSVLLLLLCCWLLSLVSWGILAFWAEGRNTLDALHTLKKNTKKQRRKHVTTVQTHTHA